MSTRRSRLLRAVGPHKQTGDVIKTSVPARLGVGAHTDFTVTTACGKTTQTTLATRRDDLVRCPDCLGAMAGAPKAGEEC